MQIRHSKEMIKGVSSGVSIIIKLVSVAPLSHFACHIFYMLVLHK